MGVKTRILIYEPDISGHHSEHVRHIIEYVSERWSEADIDLVHIVHPEFSDSYPEISTTLSQDESQTLVELPLKMYEERRRARGIRRTSLEEWRIVRHYAKEFGADHCVLLNLNIFQYALGFPSAQKLSFSLSGTLFHPYTRLDTNSRKGWEWISIHLERWRKYWQLKWMMRNPHLSCIHLLNDKQSVDTLNEKIGLRPIFSTLPDPVPDIERNEESAFNIRKQYGKIGIKAFSRLCALSNSCAKKSRKKQRSSS